MSLRLLISQIFFKICTKLSEMKFKEGVVRLCKYPLIYNIILYLYFTYFNTENAKKKKIL